MHEPSKAERKNKRKTARKERKKEKETRTERIDMFCAFLQLDMSSPSPPGDVPSVGATHSIVVSVGERPHLSERSLAVTPGYHMGRAWESA